MIIAFGHQKQVGKDTACNILSVEGDMSKLSLADPLYSIAEMLIPDMRNKTYYDDVGDRKNHILSNGRTVRQNLIDISENLKGTLGDDVWVNALLKEANYRHNVCISDVRYPVEFHKLKEKGAVMVKIVRPSVEHTSDVADDALLDCDEWDHVLLNDGSFEKFKRDVLALYEEIKNVGRPICMAGEQENPSKSHPAPHPWKHH